MLNSRLLIPIGVILSLAACQNIKNNNNKTSKSSEPFTKDVKEITYIDEGAVVPNARVRNISIVLKDSAHATLSYLEYSENQDSTQKNILIPQDQIEEIYDNLVKLSDIPDGMEIIPGKVPCVGRKGVNVAIIFNTGDTSHFKISGGALCDNDVIPEWKFIDSVSNILYNNSLASRQ